MTKPLLSIAIPTYKRAALLDLCLGQICKQLEQPGLVELIVSDNASPDDTPAIVKKYQDAGHKITYTRNEENVGADRNILQAFKMATGKYVVVFSDDDVLIEGAIDGILKLLSSGNYGIVHLNSFGFSGNYQPSAKATSVTAFVYKNKKRFIRKTNYLLTFISGTIINKELIGLPDYEWSLDTNLVQMSWHYKALLDASENAYVDTKLVAVKEENTGGYNIFKVFGTHIVKVHRHFIDAGYDASYFRIVENQMLIAFYPLWITRLRQNQGAFTTDEGYTHLLPLYRGNLYFWLCTVPAFKLPIAVSRIGVFFCRAWKKLLIVSSDAIGKVTGDIKLQK
ncbi:MAG: glycosyltransferase family 2 protein [Bacteroidota bacterium]